MRFEPLSSVPTLHREMNRLFGDLCSGLDAASALARGRAGWPSVERIETDQGLRLSAEPPRLDERDAAVPFAVEEDKAEAALRKGVLSVTLPRSAEAQARRIAITNGAQAGTAH